MTGKTRENLRILLICSDLEERAVLGAQVSVCGFWHAVHPVGDPEEALRKTVEHTPDLAIYHRPGSDEGGVDLCRKFGAEGIPVLVIGSADEAKRAEADAHLLPACSCGALIERVWGFFPALRQEISSVESPSSGEVAHRYQDLFERASDAILLMDVDTHTIIEANLRAKAMYGYTRDELIGMNLLQLVSREQHPIIWENARRMAKGEAVGKMINRVHVRKDGSAFPVSLSAGLIQYGGRRVFQDIIRDETEREALIQNLKESREWVELALDVTQVGIWDWDVATDTVTCSEAYYRQYGLPPDHPAPSGEWWFERIHPDDQQKVYDALDRAAGELPDYRTEFRVVWDDGSVHWLAGKGRAFYDENGHRVRLMGANIDITPIKRAEEDLQKANAELERRVVERTGELLRANARLQTLREIDGAILRGASESEIAQRVVDILGRQIGCLRAGIAVFDHAGDRAEVIALFSAIDTSILVGAVYTLDEFGDVDALKKGRQVLVRNARDPSVGRERIQRLPKQINAYVKIPIIIDGDLLGSLNLASDSDAFLTRENLETAQEVATQLAVAFQQNRLRITLRNSETQLRKTSNALAESERMLRTLMGNLPGMAYRCRKDADWTMEFISEGCLALTGYPASDLMHNRRISYERIIHPDDRAAVRNDVQSASRANRPFELEYRIVTADGEEKWVWEQGLEVFSGDGGASILEGFIADITARKRAEARSQVLIQRLVDVQETERRNLARELHDEIGQALTTVKIDLQMRQELAGRGDGDFEAGIAVVNAALEQVRGMSLNLRPSVLDDFGLHAALRWLVERHREIGSDIELVMNAGERRYFGPIETVCFRVAQEALTNALRHGRAERIAVSLAEDARGLELRVVDNGTGFDVETARSRALLGHSSGLLNMEERVNLVGGTLSIVSSSKEGTVVCVTFAPDMV